VIATRNSRSRLFRLTSLNVRKSVPANPAAGVYSTTALGTFTLSQAAYGWPGGNRGKPTRWPMPAVPCAGGWTSQILGTPRELQSGFTPYEKSTVAMVPAATVRWWVVAALPSAPPGPGFVHTTSLSTA